MCLCTNSKCCCCGFTIHGAEMVSPMCCSIEIYPTYLLHMCGNSSRKTSLQRFLTFLVYPIDEPYRFRSLRFFQFPFRAFHPTEVATRGTPSMVLLNHIRKSCVVYTRLAYFLLLFFFCFQFVSIVEQWKYHFICFPFACNCECLLVTVKQ